MDMQWLMVSLGVLGFFLTWTGMVVSVTRAVTIIKSDTAEKITTETDKITYRLNEIRDQFEEDQRTQNSRFGEVALSLRQYVANVEKELHQIEIWGRDNFVLNRDYVKAVERLEHVIDAMSIDIKIDFKTLGDKIEKQAKD